MHLIFASGTEMKRKFNQQPPLFLVNNSKKSFLENFIGIISSNIDYFSDLSHSSFDLLLGRAEKIFLF